MASWWDFNRHMVVRHTQVNDTRDAHFQIDRLETENATPKWKKVVKIPTTENDDIKNRRVYFEICERTVCVVSRNEHPLTFI